MKLSMNASSSNFRWKILVVTTVYLALLSGCATITSATTSRMAGNIQTAILNQDDPETVRDGAPAFLLMMDGLISGDPDSVPLLIAGSRLYGAYASAFVADEERAKRLAAKARMYARHAMCIKHTSVCMAIDEPLEQFTTALQQLNKKDLPVLYAFATSWAGWVQANTDDWNAIAELPKVTTAIYRITELDNTYEQGEAYLYLGVLNSQLPPALGGKPEIGRGYFEQAITLSQGRRLMDKVLFAEHYARLVFDRQLHDQLLQEVLDANPRAPGLTLANVLAQVRAQQLLEDSDAYF